MKTTVSLGAQFIYGGNFKQKEIVRYKYIDKFSDDRNNLDYSFGTIKPDIEFVGFGFIENAVKVPLKKELPSHIQI